MIGSCSLSSNPQGDFYTVWWRAMQKFDQCTVAVPSDNRYAIWAVTLAEIIILSDDRL